MFIHNTLNNVNTEAFNPAPGDLLACKLYIQPASADLNFTLIWFSSDPKEQGWETKINCNPGIGYKFRNRILVIKLIDSFVCILMWF